MAHCAHVYCFPSLSLQSYDYARPPPLLSLKKGVRDSAVIINDPGSGGRLTLLHQVSTLIRPFRARMRSKQTCLELKGNVNVFLFDVSCCVFHVNHFIFPLVTDLVFFFFLSHSSAAWCVRQFFHHDRMTQGSCSRQGYPQSVCRPWWFCS